MHRKFNRPGVFLITLLLSLFFTATVYAGLKVGWLVKINAEESKITIDEALGYPEKKHVTYSITKDARWHICTAKACILKEGAEGYTTFKEVVKKEAYGKPYKSFRVLLEAAGKKVKELEIQVTVKMH